MSEPIEKTKRSFWFKEIEEWESGTASQKDFCAKKNINLATFVYWRKKHRSECVEKREAGSPAALAPWIRLTPRREAQNTPAPQITIEIEGRYKITLPLTQDMAHLTRLVTLLGLNHVFQK